MCTEKHVEHVIALMSPQTVKMTIPMTDAKNKPPDKDQNKTTN